MEEIILITGGQGFIGSHLKESLLRQGYRIKTFNRWPSKSCVPEEYSHLEGNITDLTHVKEAVKDVDGVIHLAGISRESVCEKYPRICLETNLLGTLNVLESIKELPITKPWLMVASSGAVKDILDRDIEYPSGNSWSLYAIGKLMNELIARAYAQMYALKTISVRLASVYGSIKDDCNRVLNRFIKKALLNEDIHIVSRSKKLFFIHVEDVIRAFSAMIELISRDRDGYWDEVNLGPTDSVTIGKLATKIVKHCKNNSRIIYDSENNSCTNFGVDSGFSEYFAAFDFSPEVRFENGLI